MIKFMVTVVKGNLLNASEKIIAHQVNCQKKMNSGVAKARNAGIEFASGEFLIFVDPDDYIDLDFCEKLYKKAVENNAFVVKAQKKMPTAKTLVSYATETAEQTVSE